MFFRRGMAGPDAWLTVKMWLFGVGSLLALLGMGLENRWLIGASALVLLAGFLLRFLDRKEEADRDV